MEGSGGRLRSILCAWSLQGQVASLAPDVLDCDSGEQFRLLGSLQAKDGCTWQPIEGAVFLPEYATGVALAAGSLATAKVHCEALGAECAGVTLQPCRPNSILLYSLRAQGQPRSSPQGEISWRKLCDERAEPLDADALCTEQSDLQQAAQEFYASGVVNVNLLMTMGSVLRSAAAIGWHRLAAQCGPAVLQTLLLRQEERLFVDYEEYEDLEDIYLEILHQMLADGVAAAWPLRQGFSRVSGLRREVQHQAGPSSVDFVLCFCGVAKSPGGGYPVVEDELGWLTELLKPHALHYRQHTRVFVKEKCGAEGFELQEKLRDALLPFAHVVTVDRVDDALRADDATAYLHHLVEKYDDLAAWTFFLHADAPEHVHPFRLLEEVLSAARSGALHLATFPFLYLSHNYLDLGTSIHTWDDFASPRLWKRLFGGSLAPPREVVKGYCCVQFLVPKRRALLRSRNWYESAFGYFASETSYFELFPAGRRVTWQDLTCRTPAQLWMPWWHVVFGEELTCPERHQDPRLPLFIQLRSIPPDRIQCC